MLAQLGWLFWREAEAQLPDPYAWPAPEEPTPAQRAEHARLRITSSALWHRARAAGFFSSGLDTVFAPAPPSPYHLEAGHVVDEYGDRVECVFCPRVRAKRHSTTLVDGEPACASCADPCADPTTEPAMIEMSCPK
jgi:hypothetical protein